MPKAASETAAKLKELIDRNGPTSLSDEPYEAYRELKRSGAADNKTASAILYLLASEALDDIEPGKSPEELSKTIQGRCCLRKGMADHLADIFSALYSHANADDWNDRHLKGYAEFLEEEFECNWVGFAVWDADGGTVDCHYQAELVLAPKDRAVIDAKLDQPLKNNPFMEAADIRDHFVRSLRDYLDDTFREYCECDDYYQPVVEDFEIAAWTTDWCRENGFEIISCEGEGYDDGFDPKVNRSWW